jgi:hypothetical protein
MEPRDGPAGEAEVFLGELNGALAAAPLAPRTESQEVRYLRERVRALRHEKAGLRVELAQARQECGRLREALGAASGESEAARRQAERSGARLAELTALLQDVYASRSWRAANRLRGALAALARRIRPRRAGGGAP